MNVPYVFGLNYETSGFEVRDKLAFTREEIPTVLQRLQSSGITREIVVLSTCNRTEIYCTTHDIDFVINAICDIQNVCPRTVKKHSYVYSGLDCASHIFRVVSGLESMVLGETEIVAQVKDAWHLSKEHRSIGTTLSSIFQMALMVEKDVRNATEINNIAVSMGHALVNLVAVNFDSLVEQSILFIGAGQMMNQIAPHFKNVHVAKRTIMNRTLERGEALAKRTGADCLNLSYLAEVVNDYSILIVCSGSSSPILNADILQQTIMNPSKKLLIIDLSMPLLTNLNLRKYENIVVLTVDDIAKIVDVGLERRKLAAMKANEIIDQQVVEYQNWLKRRGLTPVIRALRNNADEIRQEVLSEAEKKLQNGEAAYDVLRAMSVKLTNKLIHNPTVNLCASEDKLQDELTGLISYLYDLNVQA